MTKESATEMWEYPAHTKAKHDILDDYLGGWFAKLSNFPRILFFDGFAGRGVYNDGTAGSPLIALKKLLTHTAFPRMTDCEFVFFFVEKDPENVRVLNAAIAELLTDHSPLPKNVKVQVIEGTFNEVASQISAQMQAQKRKQAPTFAFVDPFGYSGLPMNVIADFTQYRGSEVFVNFMVGHVQRFIGRAGQENAIEELFGLTPEAVMRDFVDDQKRVEYLRDVYMRQLKEKAKFEYVHSFAMKNASGNVTYYLVHGTRHTEGVRLMKAAMWKVDPGAGHTFSDRLAGREVLFELDPDLSPLRDAIASRFAGEDRVSVEDIRRFTYLETPYRETHVISVLKPLELAGKIRVDRQGKNGFNPLTTWITFPSSLGD